MYGIQNIELILALFLETNKVAKVNVNNNIDQSILFVENSITLPVYERDKTNRKWSSTTQIYDDDDDEEVNENKTIDRSIDRSIEFINVFDYKSCRLNFWRSINLLFKLKSDDGKFNHFPNSHWSNLIGGTRILNFGLFSITNTIIECFAVASQQCCKRAIVWYILKSPNNRKLFISRREKTKREKKHRQFSFLEQIDCASIRFHWPPNSETLPKRVRNDDRKI